VTTCAGCEARYTPFNQDGHTDYGYSMPQYLDRHFVQCNTDEALKGFQLERDSTQTYVRYKYVCCKLATLAFRGMQAYAGASGTAQSFASASVNIFSWLPFGCGDPGALLQSFKLNTIYTPFALWIHCSPWRDCVAVEHDDWCANDFGSTTWNHSLSGSQGGCTLGFGRGYCRKQPQLTYSWGCLGYSPPGKVERRTCRNAATQESDVAETADLASHQVFCGDDELLTKVQWVTTFAYGNSNTVRGQYQYTCCAYA
jgi:hypothetical protein